MNKDELKKMKKEELITLVLGLETNLAASEKELNQLKAKMQGKIGYTAGSGRRNELVK